MKPFMGEFARARLGSQILVGQVVFTHKRGVEFLEGKGVRRSHEEEVRARAGSQSWGSRSGRGGYCSGGLCEDAG